MSKKPRVGRIAQEKISKYHDKVGTVPDRVVADMAGVSLSSVRNYRVDHGIKAAGTRGGDTTNTPEPLPPEPEEAAAAATGRRRSKVSEFHDLVGTVPDRVIAEKAGVGVNTVHAYRKRHGITAAGRRNSEARNRSAKVMSGEGMFVWQVLFKTTEEPAFVVAASLVDAASKAESASTEVLGVEKVGRVL